MVKSQDRRGNSTDRLSLTTERRMTWVLDPSHEAGCARLTRTRRRPPSFVTPRTTIFQGLRRDAEDCAETGPSVKPCAWMVTNHVLELNQLDAIGVGLSAALHRLTRARDTRRGLAGPMRRFEASARRERVGALRQNIGNLLYASFSESPPLVLLRVRGQMERKWE